MTKYELIRLLDDPDVREKILFAVNKRETPSPSQNLFRAEDEARRLKDQLRARDAEVSSANKRAEDWQRRAENYRRQHYNGRVVRKSIV